MISNFNQKENRILENNYCCLTYIGENDQYLFTCVSKENNDDNLNLSLFEAIGINNKKWNDDFFNFISGSFNNDTKIDDLYNLFNPTYNLFGNMEVNFYMIREERGKINQDQYKKEEAIIDVNKASEDELSKLPGINIAIAKKIISIRENQGGFCSVDDFIESVNIKDHYAKIIKGLIKVSEIKKIKTETNARIVDI